MEASGFPRLVVLFSLWARLGLGDPGICGAKANQELVGCLSASLAKSENDHFIHFKSNDSVSHPEACFKTCRLIYPQSTVALISWNKEQGLDCQCGHADSLEVDKIGPEVFCDQQCDTISCGGEHRFQSGLSETYFSVFCLGVSSESRMADPLMQRLDSRVGLTDDSDEAIEETLNAIWLSLTHTNVLSIVITGLLVVVIILMLVLLVWLYQFFETYDKTANAKFYRTASASLRRPPLSEGAPNLDYGATNTAFDPNPETEGHDETNDPDGSSSFYESHTESSTETRPNEAELRSDLRLNGH